MEPDWKSTAAEKMFAKTRLESIEFQKVISTAVEALSQLSDESDLSEWETVINEISNNSKNQVKIALRYALTGFNVGAGLPETMSTLGRQECLQRLHNCVNTIRTSQ